MSKAELRVRHLHTESVVPEYHHAINHFLRNFFWYIVVAVVTVITSGRFIAFSRRHWNSLPAWTRKSGALSYLRPVQPVVRLHALGEAFLRHLSYRRFVWTSRWLKYLSPPSPGEALFLCLYWAVLLLMLWTNVIFKSASPLYGIEWEVVGFRAAWVSTTQLPLVYCTGCRINPISLLTGISHERMNWFHRWAARTVFLTLIVHWSFFYREWDLSNFVQQEIEIMPMVIWGFAAWGMFGFMVITGFGFFRGNFYEIWLLVHILSAYSGLWLTYTHTHCTTYFVLASASFIAFDMCGRLILYITSNIHLFSEKIQSPAFGYNAELRMINDNYILLSIPNVSFRWKAGQHVYITIPHLRKVESHPFTIANLPEDLESSRGIALVIKPQQGFTLDLARWTLNHQSKSLRVFMNGPYGNPPPLAGHDTIVLIATSNRASFIVPLLQELASPGIDVPTVSAHLICRELSDMKWYLAQIQAFLKSVQLDRTEFEIQVHITSMSHSDTDVVSLGKTPTSPSLVVDQEAEVISGFEYEKNHLFSDSESSRSSTIGLQDELVCAPGSNAHELHSLVATDGGSSRLSPSIPKIPNEIRSKDDEDKQYLLTDPAAIEGVFTDLQDQSPTGRMLTFSKGRPSVDAMVRPPIIDAHGKVLVVAAVEGTLRNQVSLCVARLNREIIIPALRGREDTDTGPSSLELWCEVNGDVKT